MLWVSRGERDLSIEIRIVHKCLRFGRRSGRHGTLMPTRVGRTRRINRHDDIPAGVAPPVIHPLYVLFIVYSVQFIIDEIICNTVISWVRFLQLTYSSRRTGPMLRGVPLMI
jgi:hypothetical protein